MPRTLPRRDWGRLDRHVTANVRMLVAQRRCKPEDLYTYLGMGKSAYYERMRGHARWTLSEVAGVAEFFGIEPDDLTADPDDRVQFVNYRS